MSLTFPSAKYAQPTRYQNVLLARHGSLVPPNTADQPRGTLAASAATAELEMNSLIWSNLPHLNHLLNNKLARIVAEMPIASLGAKRTPNH